MTRPRRWRRRHGRPRGAVSSPSCYSPRSGFVASVIALVDAPVHAVPVGRAIHMAHPADGRASGRCVPLTVRDASSPRRQRQESPRMPGPRSTLGWRCCVISLCPPSEMRRLVRRRDWIDVDQPEGATQERGKGPFSTALPRRFHPARVCTRAPTPATLSRVIASGIQRIPSQRAERGPPPPVAPVCRPQRVGGIGSYRQP